MLSAKPLHRRSIRYWRRLLTGPLIMLLTLLIMLGLGEFYFRYINLQSDSFNFTLMMKHWLDVCWKPTFHVTSDKIPNGGLDFRDKTWTESDVQGKTKIMVVGDSFAAGHGICNAADRFGDVLQAKLGDKYAVFNVAVNGWDTVDELTNVPLYPYKPDIVILSYVTNDIDNAIRTVKGNLPVPFIQPQWSTSLLSQSFLLDYIYWQIIYKRQFAENGTRIDQSLLDSYLDPEIWAVQQENLVKFSEWAKRNNAPLIVIAWPRLDNVASSAKPLQLVSDVFTSQGATIIDGTEMFKTDAPSSLIVSPVNTHPNEKAHRRIADALYSAVIALHK